MRVFVKFVGLFASLALLLSCAGSIGTQKAYVDSVLGGQAANNFVNSNAHPLKPDSIQPVQMAGRDGVRFLIRYEDEGVAQDWIRYGKPGSAQRIQYRERDPQGPMKQGADYWYTYSFFVEAIPGGRTQFVSPFDVKPKFKTSSGGTPQGQPLFGAHFWRGQFFVFDSFGVLFECGEYTDANSRKNFACDRGINYAILGPQRAFTGRWVDVVFHVKWSNDNSGIFRYWVDGKNRFVFRGNTARGADQFIFKFGPYRHHMVGPHRPLAISYADIVRASTCEGLGLSNCGQLEASGQSVGRRNLASFSVDPAYTELSDLRRNPTDEGMN